MKEHQENPATFNLPVVLASSVVDCAGLFQSCFEFNQPLTIPSGVEKCWWILRNCKKFNSPVIIEEGVEDCHEMFYECESFNQPITLPKSVKNCDDMFRGCTSFNQPVNLPESLKRCKGMFINCKSFNQPVKIPEGVVRCNAMFVNCEALNEPVELPQSIKNCASMFSGCTSFNQPVTLPKNVEDVKPGTNVVLVPPKRSGESTTVRNIKYVLSGNRQYDISSDEIRKLMPAGLHQKMEELLKQEEFISLELEEETVNSMNVLAIYFDGPKFAIGVTSEWSGTARLYDSGTGKDQVEIRGNLYPRHMVSEDKELLLMIIDDFIKTGKPSKQVKWKNG